VTSASCANALGASFSVVSRHFTPLIGYSALQLLAECFAPTGTASTPANSPSVAALAGA